MRQALAPQEFIILPPTGFIGEWSRASEHTRSFVSKLAEQRRFSRPNTYWLGKRGVEIQLLDLIPDGPLLVSMPEESYPILCDYLPELVVSRMRYFSLAQNPPGFSGDPSVSSGNTPPIMIRIHVESTTSAAPVAGALVQAFYSSSPTPIEGTTDSNGDVSLPFDKVPIQAERLVVLPSHTYWSRIFIHHTLSVGVNVLQLDAIDLSGNHALRHFYPTVPSHAGAGVRVGVVDTGIAPHTDLSVHGGANLDLNESWNGVGHGDNGTGHGTHVAGIIGAHGSPPTGLRGLAPAVALHSYRVCPQDKTHATEWAIMRGIERAVQDQCDLINISIVYSQPSMPIRRAIAHAAMNGLLIFAAAGNDGRQAVAFPAADNYCIAVSAMGNIRTFPNDSDHAENIAMPRGSSSDDFVASFTNIGTQIRLVAPGVGIVSTAPGNRYCAWSGTSMACAAAVGAAASILGNQSAILAMPRNIARYNAMAQHVLSSAASRSFGARYEGRGML